MKLRYELINDSGLLTNLIKSNIKESDKWDCISQILGVNVDNARKLYSGTYDKGKSSDEEISRKKYFEEILKKS